MRTRVSLVAAVSAMLTNCGREDNTVCTDGRWRRPGRKDDV